MAWLQEPAGQQVLVPQLANLGVVALEGSEDPEPLAWVREGMPAMALGLSLLVRTLFSALEGRVERWAAVVTQEVPES